MTIPSAALTVELSWQAGPGQPDVDLTALVCGPDGHVRSDADMVFYNQPAHPSSALAHAGKHAGRGIESVDTVAVSLDRTPSDIDKLVFCASANDVRFGDVRGLALHLRDASGAVLAEFHAVGVSDETALVIGEMYRRQGAWKFRAVGQGFASGLAGLATEYGIDVSDDAEHSTALKGAPAVDAIPSPIRMTKGEERLPVEMREALDLRKRQVAVVLTKAGLPSLRARVLLVLDASGSMAGLYLRGVVARAVERIAAVAAQLDDDGIIEAWTFASNPGRLPDLHVGDMPAWLPENLHFGGTSIDGSNVDWEFIGWGNEEQRVIAMVSAHLRRNPSPDPSIVLFFSDGGVSMNKEIERALRASEDLPVFWQFIGLGNADYGVLESFDTLPGRSIDNVGFFALDDIEKISDERLYARILSEFPIWIRAAQVLGITP